MLQFGPFLLDPRARRLLRDGVAVDLPPRAFALLLLLAGKPREVLRRDALMDALWPDGSEVSEGALSQLVLVLRRGLGPEGTVLVRTVAKVGYALDADVVMLAPPAAPTSAPCDATGAGTATAPIAAVPMPSPTHAPPAPRRARTIHWGARIALLLALLGALATAVEQKARVAGEPRLAISGIRVADGADAAPAWAANALHDLLAARLRGQPGIALRQRDDIEPEPTASALPVLDGAVRRDPADPAAIAVDWRLRGGGSDATWRDTVPGDRLFEALPRLQAELRRRLGGLPSFGLDARTRDDAALFDYTAGVQALGEGRLVVARAAFERAVAAAPRFALAHHALARTLHRLGYRDLALSHAREALAQLDATDPGHALVAQQMLTLLNRHDEAVAHARRLLERQPGDIEWTLLLAASQTAAGQLEAATATLAAVDPAALSPRWRTRWLGQRMRLAVVGGQPDAALSLAQDMQASAERHAFADLAAESRMARADVLNRQARYAEAQAVRAEAIAWYDRAGAAHEALRARALQLGSAAWAGIEPAFEDYDTVRRQARELGNPEVEAGIEFALANRAAVHWDYAAQQAHLLTSRALLRRLGAHPWLPTNTAALSESDLRVGRLDATWARLEADATAADGRASERWRLTRARAIVRRALDDLPGAIALTRRAAAQAREDGIDGHPQLECEALSLDVQRIDGAAAAPALRDCLAALAGASSDEDLAWRAALHAALALFEHRQGAVTAAREHLRQGEADAFAVQASDRADAQRAIAPAVAVVAGSDAADATLARLLDEPWARPASRQRAELLALRCLAGASPAARAACSEAPAVAPSDEGWLGALLGLITAREAPDGPAASAWWAARAASGDAVLRQLAGRAGLVDPADPAAGVTAMVNAADPR